MEKLTAAKLLGATKSFVTVRAIVGLIITGIMLVVGILGGLLCVSLAKNDHVIAAYIIAVIIFGGLIGFLRFANRYCLYLIKAGHIAAITEYIKTGSAPAVKSDYQGVLAYGTDVIKANFKEVNIGFAADALIAGATKQIMKWVNKAGKLLSFIPGGETVMSFVELVLSTALNYVDEAVLSYVFYKKDEVGNGFKKTCDGLVYYAQSWKKMLLGAVKVSAFVWVIRIVSYGLFFLVFTMLGKAIFAAGGVIVALILAFVLLYGLESIIVVPFATCLMINDYHKAIAGQPIKADLYGTLCKVSRKFKDLFGRSEQPPVAEPATVASPF